MSSPVGSNNVSISSSPTESPIAKDDPLSMFKQQAATEKPAFFDPLRMMQSQAAEEKQKEKEKEEAAAQAVVSNTEDVSSSSTTSSSSSSTAKTFEPWRDKRARILTKYTTNKSIPVSANFLEEEVVTAPKGNIVRHIQNIEYSNMDAGRSMSHSYNSFIYAYLLIIYIHSC